MKKPVLIQVMAAALVAQSVWGQVPITDQPTCAKCTIVARVHRRFGPAEGPGSLGVSVLRVSTDARGRYWVFEPQQMPLVFNADGSFLTTVGRSGDGPGEMRAPYFVISLPGDSVAIMDGQRMNVFNSRFEFARSIRLPSPYTPGGLEIGWPKRMLLNAHIRTADRAGLPLHVVDASTADGQIVNSFGSDGQLLGGGEGTMQMTLSIAPSVSGSYWTASRTLYEVTKRDVTHRVVDKVIRRPEWFPGLSDGRRGGPITPPSPQLIGLYEDPAGLLWTYAYVASPTYKLGWKKASDLISRADRSKPAEVPSNAIDSSKLFHTRVEVIDPRTKRVVTSTIIREYITSVLPDGLVALVKPRTDGSLEIQTLRLSLKRN